MMGRDTGFSLYGEASALRRIVDGAPAWVRADEQIQPLGGGMAQFDILYWRNRPELARHFERDFGVGDSSNPKALWVGDDFVGVHIKYDDIRAVSELLVDFIEGWDGLESSDAHWFLGRFGLDLGRAVYWWKIQGELQAAGIEVVWYDSY